MPTFNSKEGNSNINGGIIYPTRATDIINPPNSSLYEFIGNRASMNVSISEVTDDTLTFNIIVSYNIMDFTDYRWSYASESDLNVIVSILCHNYIGLDFYSSNGDNRNNNSVTWSELQKSEIHLAIDDDNSDSYLRNILTDNLFEDFKNSATSLSNINKNNFPFNMINFRYGLCGSKYFIMNDMNINNNDQLNYPEFLVNTSNNTFLNWVTIMQNIANGDPTTIAYFKVWENVDTKQISLNLTIPRNHNTNKTYRIRLANPNIRSYYDAYYYDEVIPGVIPTETVTTYDYNEGSITPTNIGNVVSINARGNGNNSVKISIEKATDANVLIDKNIDLQFSLTKVEHTI